MPLTAKILISAFFICIAASQTNAQTVFVQSISEAEVLDVSDQLLILPDSAGILETSQVISGRIDLLFIDNFTLIKGIGKNTQRYWGKLKLTNEQSKDVALLMKMPTYFPEIAVFVTQDKKVIDTLRTGNNIERSLRSSQFAGHIPGTIDLLLPAKASYTLYFRFQFDWRHYQPKKITVNLYDQASQNIIYSNRKLLFGLVFGVMLVMVIYNLAFYLAVKDRGYLYYVLYITITGLFSINYTNYTFHYLWPSLPEWHRLSFVHLGSGSIATFLLFSKKFIRLYEVMPKLNQVINVGMLLMIAPIISLWLGDIYTADILMALLALATFSVVLFFVVVVIVRRKNRAAYFLLAGFIALISCFTLFLLFFFGPLKGDFEVYSYLPQIGVVAQIVIFGIGLSDRVYQLQIQNKKLLEAKKDALEEEVQIRTAEVTQQKEEIAAQRDDIERKNNRLEDTLKALRKSQRNIQSSLNYAQRIQQAFLPQKHEIGASVQDFFILHRPKDIVSGDFYWFHALPNKRFLMIVADCTGHGVPGAFMSMIGESLLDKIVIAQGVYQPNEILNELHRQVIKVLRQDATQNRDGMDINICLIDRAANELHFAGARNQMMVIQDGVQTILKGDKQSIGGYNHQKHIEFTNQCVPIGDEVQCYMATDGYRDQIGGKEGRKIYQKTVDKLLMEVHRHAMDEQGKALSEYLERWMGTTHKQLDDILFIGFRA